MANVCLQYGTYQVFQSTCLSFKGKGHVLTKARTGYFLKETMLSAFWKQVWQCCHPYVISLPKRYKSVTYKNSHIYVPAVLELWPKDPWGSPRPFSGSMNLKPCICCIHPFLQGSGRAPQQLYKQRCHVMASLSSWLVECLLVNSSSLDFTQLFFNTLNTNRQTHKNKSSLEFQ